MQGKLRVTVQGEIIEQQFGEKEVCFRTLDLYTSAVLEAVLDPPPAPQEVRLIRPCVQNLVDIPWALGPVALHLRVGDCMVAAW